MLDVEDDYEIFDNTEDIDLVISGDTQRNNDGSVSYTDSEIAVTKALRRQTNERIAEQFGGRFQIGDALWELWTTPLSGTIPARGMKIVNNLAEIWEILAVDEATLQSRFRCYCRK